MSTISDISDPARPPIELEAAGEHEGLRLDQFLASSLPELSRSRLQALVREGHLRLEDRRIAEPAYRVKPGERFRLELPPLKPARPLPERQALEILFEDEHLIVLVKPAGMVVHPAPGHSGGTLVNVLLAHCQGSLSGIGGVERPGIVHRLDREVSGVMVAAKSDRAHVGLAGQFAVHSLTRIYEAIVWGLPATAEGRIDRPIGRHPTDRKRMAVVGHGGKRAVTHWRLLEAAGTRAARLAFRLETGRTHQIRVHASSMGHPIVGDRVYGQGRSRETRGSGQPPPLLNGLERILLHARHLAFKHPVTGSELAFDVPPPSIFARMLEELSP